MIHIPHFWLLAIGLFGLGLAFGIYWQINDDQD
jgi:hypothetical protein